MADSPYRRFLILSSPRCGTHMLRSSFDGHPSIVAHTELFNPDWNRNEPIDDTMSAAEILTGYLRSRHYGPQVKAVGFALHRSGAAFGNWPDLWSLLEADAELHVISLRRCDLLRRFVSFRLLQERNRSGLGHAYVPAPRAYGTEELQEEFERAEQEIAAFDARFAGHPLLRVTYEQLCRDYSAVLRRIQVFLGVQPRPVQASTVRNAAPPLEDLITNFDELTIAFAATRWGWFFRRTSRAVRAGAFAARATVTVDPWETVEKTDLVAARRGSSTVR